MDDSWGVPFPEIALNNWSLLFRAALAGVLGALLLWLGLWLAQYRDATLVFPQVTITADRLRLAEGGGGSTEEGLSVPSPRTGKPALILVAESGFSARDYDQISWDINGLPENAALAVLWSSSVAPGKGQTRRLSALELATGLVTLASEPAWQGQIVQLGLLLKGAWTSPLLVKSLSLHRKVPSPMDVLEALGRDWKPSEPWTQRSINFHIGVERGRWLTPVTTLAMWVATGFLVFVLISRPLIRGSLAAGFACLALTAWFLLDVRWQWQLGERLLATYQTYGGLTMMERSGAAPDNQVRAAVGRIREQLPDELVRVFIIHQETSAYLPGRIRYHLLPYPAYVGLSHLPGPDQVQAGDHLLVLANVTGVRYDPQGGRLVGSTGGLAVESRLAIPGIGTLYRIQGGP
jgi:hypothetical protein